MPYRVPFDGSPLPDWKHDLNTIHKWVGARVEHALAHDEDLQRPTQLRTQTRWRLVRDTRGTAQIRNVAVTY